MLSFCCSNPCSLGHLNLPDAFYFYFSFLFLDLTTCLAYDYIRGFIKIRSTDSLNNIFLLSCKKSDGGLAHYASLFRRILLRFSIQTSY